MPIIVGVVVVAGLGIGLFVMNQGGERRPASSSSSSSSATTSGGGVGSDPGAAFAAKQASKLQAEMNEMRKDPKGQAYIFTEECKRQARGGDVDGAVAKLKSALGKWGGTYDPELYYSMAVILAQKGDSADINRQKYEYYTKAKAKLEAGGEWANDPLGNRTSNLKTVIEVAQRKAGF